MNLTMSLASAAACALLHSLWEVALIALLAWASLALLRGASAGTRHAAGMAWLVAMAVAPVATFALYWHAPTLVEAGGQGGAPSVFDAGDAGAPPLIVSARSSWQLVCVAQLWLLGVALMLARQLSGWRAVRRFEHEPFAPLPPEWATRFEALRATLGISRRVAVRLAGRVASPFTAHALRPLIWLPLGLLTQLPREQVEALLAHELAHIRRLDWCWNALQCAIESVLFHHPGMWWLSQRIREEREHACDDLAVSACGDPVVLAEALAELQRQRRTIHIPTLALAAEGGPLMKRVSHLLSVAPARPSLVWPGALLLLLCSGTLLAMQVAPPASLLVNLRSEISSQGELTPGNFREYTASYLGDKQRKYRISMDATGHVDEVYTEGGERKPMDAAARAWLKSVTTMEASGTPPALPAPPAMPALPALPPLPRPSESTEFKALMSGIEADPRVTALTGQPAALNRASFHGSVHTWGSRDFHLWGIDDPVGGKATFSATFNGPAGSVAVSWSGKTEAGAWKAESMTVSPLSQ